MSTVLATLSPETAESLQMPATTIGFLRAAVAAPSIHNSQPWRFALAGAAIRVLEDPDRRLAVLDPAGRQAVMSVAAAAFNLRLAMRAHGRVPVHEVLPDPHRPEVIMRVVPGANSTPRASVRRLRAAIFVRRTSRLPFLDGDLPRPALREIFAAATVEGAQLTACPPLARAGILTLTRTADDLLAADEAYRAEIAAWTGGSPQRADGVPETATGLRDARRQLPLRDFGAETRPRAVPFERHPHLVVLTTAGDSRRDWIDAGQALQRVLLTAAVHGISAAPLNQALEVPGLRRMIDTRYPGRYAQAILRLGYSGPVAPTPRRNPLEVLSAAG